MNNWDKKQRVKKRYDLTADIYDMRYSEEQEAKYKAGLANSKPTGLVLDLGCGSGLFLKHLSLEADNVVGIDISKKLLLKAKEQTTSIANVSVIQADADHLPFEDAKFDGVYAFTMLQNMPIPRETLLEAKRIVQDGGLLVVTGLKRVFSPESFRRLLHRSCLEVVSIRNDENLACHVFIARK